MFLDPFRGEDGGTDRQVTHLERDSLRSITTAAICVYALFSALQPKTGLHSRGKLGGYP